MRNHQRLLIEFIEKSKKLNIDINPVKILRTNTFRMGKSNVLIRTASDLGKRYFFGLNYINAEEIYNLDNSFIAFVCGDIKNIVFLPSKNLVKYLPKLSHDRNGEYKINFSRNLELILKGRGNRLDCNKYINSWDLLTKSPTNKSKPLKPEESIHNIIQGRLIEIGNIRGYSTYCPDKSKTFNRNKLGDMITLDKCPDLQFSNYSLLRKVDVLWFRKIQKGYYPEFAFEVEITTGVWSGFGRLASLREYDTKMYIITNEEKKFFQVADNFPELRKRYYHILPEIIGLLYSAEKNLIQLREDINL